jgi:hypothetical protein
VWERGTNIFPALKVPRQIPLLFLIEVRLGEVKR